MQYTITNSLGSASYDRETVDLHCQQYLDVREEKLDLINTLHADANTLLGENAAMRIDLPQQYPNYNSTLTEVFGLFDDRAEVFNEREHLQTAKDILDLKSKYVDTPKEIIQTIGTGFSPQRIAMMVYGSVVTAAIYEQGMAETALQIQQYDGQINAKLSSISGAIQGLNQMRQNDLLAYGYKAEAAGHDKLLDELHTELTTKEGLPESRGQVCTLHTFSSLFIACCI
ncbi:hypothetical protein EGM51_12620 [Verrucomicrobia bacterium S94]|nr:hypothetical protein EGM51_12620 [Verrucomicrobia bacterium S94]